MLVIVLPYYGAQDMPRNIDGAKGSVFSQSIPGTNREVEVGLIAGRTCVRDKCNNRRPNPSNTIVATGVID